MKSKTDPKKKNGNQDDTALTKKLVLITAVLNLLRALLDLYQKITGR